MFGLELLLVLLHPETCFFKLGLIGFDSEMKRYVSTRRVGDFLHNISYQKFIWRK